MEAVVSREIAGQVVIHVQKCVPSIIIQSLQ